MRDMVSYSLATNEIPPSSLIVAPLTNALEQVSQSFTAQPSQETYPALLAKNKLAPPTSYSLPILPIGLSLRIYSPIVSSVAFIILLSKGPQARTLLVTPLGPSSRAKWRDR